MDFLKQRLLGALFLLTLATAVIPSVFDGHIKMLSSDGQSLDSSPYQVALNQQLSTSHPSHNAESVSYVATEEAEAWSVRVGSFSDAAIARQLERKLQDAGYEAYLQPSDGHLYNVLIGPELAAVNAQTVQQQLYEQLHLQGVVVPYESTLYVMAEVQQRG